MNQLKSPERFSRRRFIKRGGICLLGMTALPLRAEQGEQTNETKLKLNTPIQILAKELDKVIPEMMHRFQVPGLSVALIREAELKWQHAYGLANAKKRTPVTDTTIFEAASLSKPLVAYTALKLCETKQLSLDSSLADYLDIPFIPDEPRLKLITLRQVLSHTSGFPNWRKGGRLTIDFTPGDRFSYSGEGYGYLQRVLERIFSQPLDKFLKKRLLIPLGMSKSSFVWQKVYEDNIAQGHNEATEPQKNWKPLKAVAAASLHTTAAEYARFMLAMMHPSANDEFRLTEITTDQMLQAQVRAADKISWGLGWGIERGEGGNSFAHFGASANGFQSFATGFKRQGVGIVILTNSSNGLRLCKDLVPLAIGGNHPIFTSPLIDV